MSARKARRAPSAARGGTPLATAGSTAPQEQPGSGVIVRDKVTRRTVVFRGARDAVAALQPAKGAIHEENWVVQSSRLAPGRGGLAELTIELTARSAAGDPGSEEPLTTTWEIDWVGVERPLTKNPLLFPDQTTPDYQTACDNIEAWRGSPQQRKRNYEIPKAALKGEADPQKDDDWEKLTGVALQVAGKLASGVEAYQDFAPVVVKNSIYDTRPATGGCGRIDTPATKVDGYLYLKMGDSLVQQSDETWMRTERWQGAKEIDADLYEGGA